MSKFKASLVISDMYIKIFTIFKVLIVFIVDFYFLESPVCGGGRKEK